MTTSADAALALSYCKLFSGLEFLVPLVEASRISRFQLHNFLRFLLSQRRLVRVFWESELGRADRITMSFSSSLDDQTRQWRNLQLVEFFTASKNPKPRAWLELCVELRFPVHAETKIFGRPQEWHEGQLSHKSSSIDVDVTRQSSARFFLVNRTHLNCK